MKVQQAKNIVKQYMVENKFSTLRAAFNDMCVYKHKLPIEQFVAVDIIARGYSDYTHLLNK